VRAPPICSMKLTSLPAVATPLRSAPSFRQGHKKHCPCRNSGCTLSRAPLCVRVSGVSDLSAIEKSKLERALGMSSGYVLNFSNKTFAEFFVDGFGIDIYDKKYDYGSGSKANRMRAFWNQESNYLVGRVRGLRRFGSTARGVSSYY